ncbi:hypothetical protein ANCDUO_23732 [Ancylostoma duodenale]|uniref:Uncharacterized protein n=1 Tax=Ancylostoma duodenale TaxID=51022 RepID=A0A0C2C8X6_9BILA|nr:hypothetical protein ANCDUO_23732 [Ancylostoma duodenale]
MERTMLGVTRLTQMRAGIRSSTLRQQWKIREAAAYVMQRYNALRVPRVDRIHWTTLAREKNKWKDCWCLLGIPEDQRESSREMCTLILFRSNFVKWESSLVLGELGFPPWKGTAQCICDRVGSPKIG